MTQLWKFPLRSIISSAVPIDAEQGRPRVFKKLHLPKLPTRESLLASRWARPFAPILGAPLLWRWNRHNVARGMALGLFVGILIPLIQSPFAAAFATLARANIAVAVVATLVTNPLTTPFFYLAAYHIGNFLLATEASNPLRNMVGTPAMAERLLHWVASASAPTALGLLVIATVSALVGYFTVHAGWRWRTARRWARRSETRAA
jgi:uncharacterized protein (DUF2062 family)